jgi:hypothetical protein
MVCSIKTTKLIAFISFLLVGSFVAGYAFAEDSDDANPLRFYKGQNGSYLQGTIKAELAYFNQNDSWFGKSEENLGEKSDWWMEGVIRPGIEGSYFLESVGEMYGRVDAVQANTQRIDGAGSNVGPDDVSKIRMEDAYIGWRSGNLFSSLGKDFLDISFGRQRYVAGTGFLFFSESSNGGERGAFWIGERKAADYAGIIRLNLEQLKTDLVYFKADDNPNSDTKVGGITLDYSLDKLIDKLGGVGGGFYYLDSKIDSRDSMKVYDVRFSLNPFEAFEGLSFLKPFKLEAEYVYEDPDNDFDEGNGWYVSGGYQFEQIPWKPGLTYRYASFDENFDPLFYGFYDWGYWFQGEILGEYVLSNSNLDSHMLRLNVQPIESISVNIFYYHFMLHDAKDFGVNSDDYADEWDMTVDWSVNDHLSFSVVGAYANPDDGAKEQTGGNDGWSYMMLYGSVKF